MSSPSRQRPDLANIHHFALTVTDVEASAAWYERVLGLQRLPSPFPHHGAEDSGYGVLLVEPQRGFAIGVHHHATNHGEAADEARTGLDHVGLAVDDRTDLESWTSWFDEQGVTHSGVTDMTEPIPYSVVVFRDPDGIQLELVHLPS